MKVLISNFIFRKQFYPFFLLLCLQSWAQEENQAPVNVNISATLVEMQPSYRWFGHEEPNYTYTEYTKNSTDKPVDHPHETGWLFSTAAVGENLKDTQIWRNDIYDFTDSKTGDFSIHYAVDKQDIGAVGFTPGMFLNNWSLDKEYQLEMWLKFQNASKIDGLNLALIDTEGRRAVISIDKDKELTWLRLKIPINSLRTQANFNWKEIKSLQLEGNFEEGFEIWFDGVKFTSSYSEEIGITDKNIVQRMAEAKATRSSRVNMAFEKAKTDGSEKDLNTYFAKLWLGEDLDEVNQTLLEIFTTEDRERQRAYSIHDDWSLHLKPMLLRMYFNFGSTSKVLPGRLEKQTEEALLDFLWEKTKLINDIHLARKSTWWLIGSENHDINAKVAALLTSQIFKNKPEFSSRNYPDKGKGGGSGYWFHQMYANSSNKGPEGNANWADGKQYNAEDHYKEWVKFWDEYISERAKKGFFLEVASPKYMKHTIPFLMNIYDFCEDQALKKKMGMFLDLIWAEWAQDQLASVRGGAKTRWGYEERTPMWEASRFYLGGPGDANHNWYSQAQSSYEWPEAVWRLALNRKGKGEYAYSSRKPGEEQPELQPRPDGLERTLAVDTEARLHRYSWVTPDYILGTQMDHPLALQSHLSAQNRWQGINFVSDISAFIAPVGIEIKEDGEWKRTDAFYRSVQHENILITQQNRRWMQQQPSWYPSKNIYEREFGIWFHGNLDTIIERDGWVFVNEGNAYVALRPLMGEYEFNPENWGGTGSNDLYSLIRSDTYDWNEDKTFLKFKDKFSPLIIEAGIKEDFNEFKDFQNYILQKSLKLQKTVAPGWYILRYGDGTAESAEIYFNASNNEIPKVNGKHIDYIPRNTFKSPFIKSAYNSGIIEINVDGLREVWDFNE